MKKICLCLALLLAISPASILAEDVSIPTQEHTPVETASPQVVEDDTNEIESTAIPSESDNLTTDQLQPSETPVMDDVVKNDLPGVEEEPETVENAPEDRILEEQPQPVAALGCDASDAVACVDGVGYADLMDAIVATPVNGTVDILKDISLDKGLAEDGRYVLSVNKSITINGNNHSLTVKTRGIRVEGGNSKDDEINVTFKNLTVTNNDGEGRVIDTRGGYFTVNINNCHLISNGAGNTQTITVGGSHANLNTINVTDSVIDSGTAGYGVIVFNPVNLNLMRTTINGYAALYLREPNSSIGSSGSIVKVVDSTLNGINPHTNESKSSFGTIVLVDGNITVELDHSTVTATTSNTAFQSGVSLLDNETNKEPSSVIFNNNSKIELIGKNSLIANQNLTNHKEYLSLNSVSSNATFKELISGNQASVGIDTGSGKTYYVDTVKAINDIIGNSSDINTIEIVSGISELNDLPGNIKIENTSSNDVIVNGEVIGSNQEGVSSVDLTEEIKNGTSDLFGENTVYYNGHFYKTLVDALNAVYMADSKTENVLYCKKNADVGTMTHGHVADNISIYGNSAFVSGGERDLEIDTFKYSRTTGKQDENGVFLDKEITVNVYDLDGIAAWGQRNTNYTVNLNFVDCDAMQRIYFTNGKNENGIINISLDNCTFDKDGKSVTGAPLPANANTTIYSNLDGKISVKNSTFTGIKVALNLNHKLTGTQTVEVINTKFIDCGQGDKDTKTYAAPIRIVSVVDGRSDLIVDSAVFVDTDGIQPSNGDILLGDGRLGKGESQGETTLDMKNTDANVMVQNSGYYNKDQTVDPSLGKLTTVNKNQHAVADSKNHFIIKDATPTQPVVTDTNKDVKPTGGWDDGGPFTTDACGNVFDRWGNEIYHAPTCVNSTDKHNSMYTLVNTADH